MDKKKKQTENKAADAKLDNKSATGTYKNHKDSHFNYSPSDVYYNTEKKEEDTKVSIPTYDAVLEAKEWVDDINKK